MSSRRTLLLTPVVVTLACIGPQPGQSELQPLSQLAAAGSGHDILVGPASGGKPLRAFDSRGRPRRRPLPKNSLRGEVSVAAADLTGDGVAEVLTGARGEVQAYNGKNGRVLRGIRGRFSPFGAGFRGAVFVAAGDVTGDGHADVVTGIGAGSPSRIGVFDGQNGAPVQQLQPFAGFTGGVRVAVADVNGDGVEDIIAGTGPGVPAQVMVFSGTDHSVLESFAPFAASFLGGVFVGAADVNGDERAEVLVGTGAGVAAQARLFDPVSDDSVQELRFEAAFTGGVRVAAGDVTGDGITDLIVGAGYSGGARVGVFDAATGERKANFLTYGKGFRKGISVAVAP